GAIHGYELRDDFAARAQRHIEHFLGPALPPTGRRRAVYDGSAVDGLARRVLDLPEPWRVVPHAEKALLPGGILLAYLPTILQVARLREALDDSPFGMAQMLQVLQRTWHSDRPSVRPDQRMVAHTGFLTHARLLTATE